MSVKIIQSRFGLVLTCLLGQIMLLAAPVQAGVEGKSYDVNVQSSQEIILLLVLNLTPMVTAFALLG